nr:hypothetical protein [Candidatus Freyarchaeota archaeon]
MVTQKSFATAFKMRRRSEIILVLVATIVGWLGLRFLYFGAYWWAAWTMAMVLHMGILNTTIFASYYIILLYLGIPYLLVYIVIDYIWIFYGVFTYSVIPYFIFLIFTSIPYTVLGIIFLELKSGEESKSGWGGIFPAGFGAAVLGFIQFIAIIVLLSTNLWAQLYFGITYILWAYTDLLITIFLPLALVVFLPISIVWGAIWGAKKLQARQSNQS